jgi:predicted RND superfamily exporter protein
MNTFAGTILKHRFLWLLGIALVSVFLLLNLGDLTMEEDETTWFPPDDPVLQAYDAFEEHFSSEEFIVVAYEWDEPFSPGSIAYLDKLTDQLERQIPYVDDAVSLTRFDDIVGTEDALEVRRLIDVGQTTPIDPTALRLRIAANPFLQGNLISQDETVVAVVLEIGRPENVLHDTASNEIIAELQRVLFDETQATGHRFYYAGGATTDAEVERILQGDIRRLFPLSLALTGLLLLLFFRHVPSIVLPLVTVVLSLGWTLGLKSLTNSPITPVSTTLFALITVIGVANSVHLISQYWKEQPRHESRRDTLIATYLRAGKPCFFTSATTAIGFGSLAVSGIPAIRQLGFFAAFGIMTAFLVSMVLVPLGMDWTSHRKSRRAKNLWLERLLGALGRFNFAHPQWVLAATVAVIIGMGIGILQIQPTGSMVDYFRKDSQVRTSIDFLDERLSGVSSTEVILHGPRDTFREPAVLEAVAGLQEHAREQPHVTAAYSIVELVRLVNRALHADDPSFYVIPDTRRAVAQSLQLYESSGGEDRRDYVSGDYSTGRVSIRTQQMTNVDRRLLLESIGAYLEDKLPDLDAEITGMDLLVSKINDRIVLTQIRSFGLAVLVITGMMIAAFGWRAGLVSIVPNILPIVFVLGLIGYGGFGLNIATAIIASIAIGIVVDDTIHYFSHFRDELRATGDRTAAMTNALTGVGKALCFSTLILTSGFAVFLFAELGIMASYGILSGTAVITALLGDLFVGPVLLSRLPVFRHPRTNEARSARRTGEDPS